MAAPTIEVTRDDGPHVLSDQEGATLRVALKRMLKNDRGMGKGDRRAAARALQKLAAPDDERSQRLVDAVLKEVGG